MATVRLKFISSSVPDREGTVYYHIMHQGRSRMLHSEHHLYPGEWDGRRSAVKVPDDEPRRKALIAVRDRIRKDMERFTRIVQRLEAHDYGYTADDIIQEYGRYCRKYTLCNFMTAVIDSLKRNGRIRTSETYTSTLNSFRKFLKEQNLAGTDGAKADIMMDCITDTVMESYQSWLELQGVVPNTVSFYCRILRAVYNRAVDEGDIEDCRPFRHVYTGIDKTVKRAISLESIRKIKALDLTGMPGLDLARDMFIMSFYLRGMSFIDMAYLKQADLQHDHVVYRRRKTGQRLMIAWTREMQVIVDKYPENPNGHLLPIICRKESNERKAYLNAGYAINRNLKKVGRMVGLTAPLTMYVARHSWASAAKAKGIPISVISEGMGHDSETTTQIYLASLDNSAVDQANTMIIKSLL